MELEALFKAARAVQENAYAPYSQFKVGAALLAESGHIFTGCNVENLSFPLSLCAERSAIAALISNGGRRILAVAVCGPLGTQLPPCGGCRQVLWEFGKPETPIYSIQTEGSDYHVWPLGDLLPHAFHTLEQKKVP
jgi:cytidine deaminase